MIGEGANDVLRAFVALVGMRDVGLELKTVLDAMTNPLKHFSKIGGFAGRKLEGLFRSPEVRVHHSELDAEAKSLGQLVGTFGANVERLRADSSRGNCRSAVSARSRRRCRHRAIREQLCGPAARYNARQGRGGATTLRISTALMARRKAT